jgi:mannose-6-phosphate isomerase-like protein (cupin superfamily)
MSGVGSQRLFENQQVIVWDFVLEPGEESPVHTHEHDYMYYVIEGSQLVLSDQAGAVLGEFEVESGSVFSLKLEGETLEIVSDAFNGFKMPVTHKVANVGTTRYREILVESK